MLTFACRERLYCRVRAVEAQRPELPAAVVAVDVGPVELRERGAAIDDAADDGTARRRAYRWRAAPSACRRRSRRSGLKQASPSLRPPAVVGAALDEVDLLEDALADVTGQSAWVTRSKLIRQGLRIPRAQISPRVPATPTKGLSGGIAYAWPGSAWSTSIRRILPRSTVGFCARLPGSPGAAAVAERYVEHPVRPERELPAVVVLVGLRDLEHDRRRSRRRRRRDRRSRGSERSPSAAGSPPSRRHRRARSWRSRDGTRCSSRPSSPE